MTPEQIAIERITAECDTLRAELERWRTQEVDRASCCWHNEERVKELEADLAAMTTKRDALFEEAISKGSELAALRYRTCETCQWKHEAYDDICTNDQHGNWVRCSDFGNFCGAWKAKT